LKTLQVSFGFFSSSTSNVASRTFFIIICVHFILEKMLILHWLENDLRMKANIKKRCRRRSCQLPFFYISSLGVMYATCHHSWNVMHVWLRMAHKWPNTITISSNGIISFLFNSCSLLITKPYVIIKQTWDYLKNDLYVCIYVCVCVWMFNFLFLLIDKVQLIYVLSYLKSQESKRKRTLFSFSLP
jgi:hypothetical protein